MKDFINLINEDFIENVHREKEKVCIKILSNSFVQDEELGRAGFELYSHDILRCRLNDFKKVFKKYQITLAEFEPHITYSDGNNSMTYYSIIGYIIQNRFFFLADDGVRFVKMVDGRVPVEHLTIEHSYRSSDYPIDGKYILDDKGYNFNSFANV